MRIHWSSIVTLSALLCCAVSGSAQNLIVNGGFETPPAAGSGNFPSSTAYYSNTVGTTQVTPAGTGWTFGFDTANTDTGRAEWFTATQKETWNQPPSATGGTYALELNSDNATEHLYVEQALSLTTGRTYTLKLDIAPETAFPNSPYPSVVVTLRDGSALGSTALATFTFTVTSSGWQTVSTSFVAPAGVSEIRFEDSAPGGSAQSDINLDNLSLVPVTPEPGTWWSAVVILVGVCALERKRFRTAFRRWRPW